MVDIFISYAQTDRSLASALSVDLEARGYTVWWDVNLIGGQSFREQLLDRLTAARAVIVIWTKNSVSSKWVLDEADEADRLKKLIPTRLPKLPMHEIPLGHRQNQTYEIYGRDRIYAALARIGVEPLNLFEPKKRRHGLAWRWIAALSLATTGSLMLYMTSGLHTKNDNAKAAKTVESVSQIAPWGGFSNKMLLLLKKLELKEEVAILQKRVTLAEENEDSFAEMTDNSIKRFRIIP